jgi:hypothetical protein
MDSKRILIDPDGDVILQLLQELDDQNQARKDISANDIPFSHGSTNNAPLDNFTIDDGTSDKHIHDTAVSSQTQSAKRIVEMQVSSRHLSLQTEYFRDMLGTTSKAPLSRGTDVVTIPPMEENLNATQILMDIIHGFTRKVPRRVDLQVFSQVVYLIDKWGCEEVAEILTDMWFEFLRPTMSECFDENWPSWIFICWVLRKPVERTILTKIAIWETKNETEVRVKRVPDRVIRKIVFVKLVDHILRYSRRDTASSKRSIDRNSRCAHITAQALRWFAPLVLSKYGL